MLKEIDFDSFKFPNILNQRPGLSTKLPNVDTPETKHTAHRMKTFEITLLYGAPSLSPQRL